MNKFIKKIVKISIPAIVGISLIATTAGAQTFQSIINNPYYPSVSQTVNSQSLVTIGLGSNIGVLAGYAIIAIIGFSVIAVIVKHMVLPILGR